MCFSPQPRTIFQHLNFKKWSRIVSFLTFSLPNVLFTTAACNFWTSELRKVLPDPQFLTFSLRNVLFATAACNFWFIRWPSDSAPAALTGLLFDWPDTRIIEKTQHFVTSLTFSADVSSFTWLWHYGIFCRLTWLWHYSIFCRLIWLWHYCIFCRLTWLWHYCIFCRLTWLLYSAFQLSILSEVSI